MEAMGKKYLRSLVFAVFDGTDVANAKLHECYGIFWWYGIFFGWWERERVEITEITEIYGLVFIFFYSVLF